MRGVSTVRNVALTVFAASGLLVTGLPNAVLAGERPVIKQYAQASNPAQSYRNDGAYERKCMTLPCGTRWCYSVRR